MKRRDRYFESKLRLLAKGKILDLGGGNPFQKYMAKYKPWFKNCSYETIDISDHYKPTIVGDIEKMPIKTGTYDGVICLSVLEHVNNPHKAVSEAHRILKKGGKALYYIPSIYPYHARRGPGGYADTFRFMKDGLSFLFKDFSKVEIRKCGGFFETIVYLTPLPFRRLFVSIALFLDKLLNTTKGNITWGYYVYAEK